MTSGVGLAIAKTIASRVHPRERLGGHHARAREADEQVDAVDHVGRARRRAARGWWTSAYQRLIGGHRAVEVVRALGVQRAARVAADDVRRRPPASRIFVDRDAGGAEADAPARAGPRSALAGELEGVEQRGEHDDRGAVLVVVEDGDVELGLQPLLDLEAARRGDVLEVDAAEAGGDRA